MVCAARVPSAARSSLVAITTAATHASSSNTTRRLAEPPQVTATSSAAASTEASTVSGHGVPRLALVAIMARLAAASANASGTSATRKCALLAALHGCASGTQTAWNVNQPSVLSAR